MFTDNVSYFMENGVAKDDFTSRRLILDKKHSLVLFCVMSAVPIWELPLVVL